MFTTIHNPKQKALSQKMEKQVLYYVYHRLGLLLLARDSALALAQEERHLEVQHSQLLAGIRTGHVQLGHPLAPLTWLSTWPRGNDALCELDKHTSYLHKSSGRRGWPTSLAMNSRALLGARSASGICSSAFFVLSLPTLLSVIVLAKLPDSC